MLLELDPKGHFTPIIIQEKRKDNLRQQREDKAPADKEGGYDRRGCSRFETERINRKLCCEDNWESASWLPIKTNLEFNVLGMQMATSGFCPPVYAKNEWKVLGQAGETSGRVWTPLPFIAMHPSPGRGQPCTPVTSLCQLAAAQCTPGLARVSPQPKHPQLAPKSLITWRESHRWEGCRDRPTTNEEDKQGRSQPQSSRLSSGMGEAPTAAPARSHPEPRPSHSTPRQGLALNTSPA